ncbi:L-asparagine transporter-like permease [Pullulanibacillus pueri]|uniref:Transporter n=1 Tax=Pullulanibacillus pueri TaxID=1437324 RepID=A0A8J2ZY76_9BACL|nr:amino acid permease [Pullulanibacillus pueri]MBM7682936.1 L-asparagine transporter-like permease [Pullulanibacillus pueri]GGH84737.1 transporter [Pullulanibacillus pueri]
MHNHHVVKQMVKNNKEKQEKKGKGSYIEWWQLSLIGIGSIMGAGFFLGTGLSIKTAGPSILIGYLIAGLTTFFVFNALGEMSVNDPEPGSFRAYASKAYGRSMGFTSGWMYWLSGLLIMSSEIVALSTFMQFWFPHVPLWIFSILFAILGFGINFLGVSNFGKIESLFAVVKIATLVIFILFGALVLFGVIHDKDVITSHHTVLGNMFPNGMKGLWSALIFIFFTFGGIVVVGIASSELKSKKDIPKAGVGLIITLVAMYLFSLFFVLNMVSWTEIDESESPFVTALSAFHIPYMDSIFNIIIISAAFSTMVGALFSISHVMVSLAKSGDAPKALKDKNSRGVAWKALLLTAAGLAVSIVFSFLLPNTVYEYITTAAGVMLILNWVIILASHLKLHPSYSKNKGTFKAFGYPITSIAGIVFILLAISGALFHANERIGLLISLGMIVVIFICYKVIFRHRHEKTNV